jgi:uncharacterized protein (TIGR03118 family)
MPLKQEVLNMSGFSTRLPIDRSVSSKIIASLIAGSALLLASSAYAVPFYRQQNLVTDDQAVLTGLGYRSAAHVDLDLQNPWGISSSPTSPFWVSDNGTNKSTVYDTFGVKSATIVPVGVPTGQVWNSGGANDFKIGGVKPAFIFATEDGKIVGRTAGNTAVTAVDNSGIGASYKGLGIGTNDGTHFFLYAANFATGNIDVFDSTYAPAALSGSFLDPNLPAGYAPFNVQNLGGTLYVTYALRDPITGDDVAGPGNGFVDAFDLNGNLVKRVASQGVLNSPWGLDIAPATFGQFANDLLVGNFGDGTINVYDPVSTLLLGTLSGPGGVPIEIDGLWGLINGNGGKGGDPKRVYFAAGIDDENHGLFGSLSVPEPGSLLLLATGLAALGAARRRKKA